MGFETGLAERHRRILLITELPPADRLGVDALALVLSQTDIFLDASRSAGMSKAGRPSRTALLGCSWAMTVH